MRIARISPRHGNYLYIELRDVPENACVLPTEVHTRSGPSDKPGVHLIILAESPFKQYTLEHIHAMKAFVAMMEKTHGKGEFHGLVGVISDGMKDAEVIAIADASDKGDPG